ncbi:MAG: hypothetical protein LAP21_20965 [Acidobacteriia bacterium]|nr:hypothetical protein [Terriglobia bacterium]
MSPRVQWLTPSPLWNELAAGTDKGPFRSPALLRFATDQFMEDLQALLASAAPQNLRNYIAQPETWQSPAAGLPPLDKSLPAPGGVTVSSQKSKNTVPPPFKFFQPVHSRFYLVCASLVCRMPSLPDHQVKSNQGERTSFVVRRLRPKAGLTGVDLSVFNPLVCDEFAWVTADRPGWAQVAGSGFAEGEENLPLSGFQCGKTSDRRRIFTGLIPASRRQTYVAGREIQLPPKGGPPVPPPEDPRKIDFQRLILDPWVEMVDYFSKLNPLPPLTASDNTAMSMAQGSAFVLIDFAGFLDNNLNAVWNAVNTPALAGSLGVAQRALYNALAATIACLQPVGSRLSLAAAIKTAKSFEQAFEDAVLTTTTPALPVDYSGPVLSDTSDPQLLSLIRRDSSNPLSPRAIQVLVEAALDEVGPSPPATVRVPAKDPENPQGDDWYIVRCAYEQPLCGMNAPPLLSDPSRPFQLASFFDPDAPARSIQVALPVDTSPAALRKYDKNVAFMISDQLSKQMSRVKGLKQLMDGDLADPNGFGLGMICSFSIPIITICAFIVLMIFLILLNIIFWWLPFFRICFPLPTLKAKKS